MNIPELPYDEFLRTVKVNLSIDHVFLLGAGASKNSEVLTASDCIWDWKCRIYKTNNLDDSINCNDYTSETTRKIIQEWFDKEGTSPPLNHPAEYSMYAERAFSTAEARVQYFKSICKGKEPSIGYRLLCLLAQFGMARLVFTTNFDGLIIKAAHQSNITPIEVTWETKERINRALSKDEFICVELHGDYKYERLKNTRKELDTQQDDFQNALIHHLKDKHLIVLGYSGRDKSLMDCLNNAYQESGGGILYWCGYSGDRSDQVNDLLNSVNRNGRKGYYISTPDFDSTLKNIFKHCFDGDIDRQQILSQVKIIKPDGNVNSIAEMIGFANVDDTSISFNKLGGEK